MKRFITLYRGCHLAAATLLALFTLGCQTSNQPATRSAYAATPLAPAGWQPPVTWIQDFLAEEIQRNQTDSLQIGILSTQQAIAIDATLFQVYVRLWERLDPAARSQLYQEQESWLQQRAELARARQQTPEGVDSNVAYSYSYATVTHERLEQLVIRLQQIDPSFELP